MNKLVIIGASGHGKVISDIAIAIGYTDIVFLDDDETIKECAGFPVEGKVETWSSYSNADYVVAIGNPRIRERITGQLPKTVSLIHPNAVIGRNVTIGEGTVIMAGAVVNHGAELGCGNIVNTGASVDHDCVLGDFVHVSVGAHVAGTVNIGDRTWIGAGAVVSNNLNITADCMIGAGAVVVNDIDESGTYIGVPAKSK